MMVFADLPEFVVVPEDAELSEDTDMYLNCVVDEDSEVEWKYNGVPVTEQFKEALVLSNGKPPFDLFLMFLPASKSILAVRKAGHLNIKTTLRHAF